MNHSIKTALFAAAVSGLLAGTTAVANASMTSPAEGASFLAVGTAAMGGANAQAKHSCKGQNSCKGQGGCKSSDNGCKGKNSCKGKGGCATNGHPTDNHCSAKMM